MTDNSLSESEIRRPLKASLMRREGHIYGHRWGVICCVCWRVCYNPHMHEPNPTRGDVRGHPDKNLIFTKYNAVLVHSTCHDYATWENSLPWLIAREGKQNIIAWLSTLPFVQVPDWIRRVESIKMADCIVCGKLLQKHTLNELRVCLSTHQKFEWDGSITGLLDLLTSNKLLKTWGQPTAFKDELALHFTDGTEMLTRAWAVDVPLHLLAAPAKKAEEIPAVAEEAHAKRSSTPKDLETK